MYTSYNMIKDHEVWSRLPFEIFERVLSFLPLPDLCRCCAVCKEWNSLVSMPQFGSLSLKTRATEGRSYIVGRWIAELDVDAEPRTASDVEPEADKRGGCFGWNIFDVQAKCWHIASSHEYVEDFELFSVGGSMAADGGLVCEYMEDECILGHPSVRVSNPLTNRGIRVLPAPPNHSTADPRDAVMDLVVDNADKSFKIFFIYAGIRSTYFDGPENALEDLMYIYDSSTELWRSSTTPPLRRHDGLGYSGTTVMFQGLLYVLLASYNNHWLFTYNILEDLWKDTGIMWCSVRFPNDLGQVNQLRQPQLVVSDNRLFLVYWGSGLHIDEILLENIDTRSVFLMTDEEVQLVFDLPEEWEWPGDVRYVKIQAFGCGKSVMLLSRETGISILYILESGVWSKLPTNPMEPLPAGYQLWFGNSMDRPLRRTLYQVWFGKTMNLRLPSTP